MKATLLLLVAATLAISATPKTTPSFDVNNATSENFYYYVHGMRGFWEGYMQGLYNTNKPHHITDMCLNSDISEKMANLIIAYVQ
jgi:patatin-like phospholipase/acyl hydrolase